MRISDWSSDVCSSDLLSGAPPPAQSTEQVDLRVGDAGVGEGERCLRLGEGTFGVEGLQSVDRALALLRAGDFHRGLGLVACRLQRRAPVEQMGIGGQRGFGFFEGTQHRAVEFGERSEEHTSELQSLMRISYAVFCLKKK